MVKNQQNMSKKSFWSLKYLILLTFKVKKQNKNRSCFSWTFHMESPFSEWSFSSKSSKDLHSQTVRARDLKFWEQVHCPPLVTCQMPYVMCHMSRVTCHKSFVAALSSSRSLVVCPLVGRLVRWSTFVKTWPLDY